LYDHVDVTGRDLNVLACRAAGVHEPEPAPERDVWIDEDGERRPGRDEVGAALDLGNVEADIPILRVVVHDPDACSLVAASRDEQR
jgi:hypothetical protein